MKVLIATDGPNITTGYGNIGRNIGKELIKRGHKVAFLSFQLTGGPVKEIETNAIIYSAFNKLAMNRSIDLFNPDTIIHIRDPYVHVQRYFPLAYEFTEYRSRCRIIGYIMVQTDPYPIEIGMSLNKNYDEILVPTNYAKQVLENCGTASNLIHVLKPAIDTKVFKPTNADKKDFGISASKMILSIGVPDRPHKNWASLLYAFSKVKERYDDVELFLHTTTGSYDLEHFISQFGLSGSVVMPHQYIKEWGFDEEIMNLLYNASDVYVSMSVAEGINLPALEALATGCNLVLTEHPNHVEIFGDNALYIKSIKAHPDLHALNYLPLIDDAVEKILKALDMPRHNPSSELIKSISIERLVDDLEKFL